MIRREPCIACPYRKDAPPGLWAASEYDKLLPYDATTSEQPFEAFACHATPEHLCHGWAVVHSNRGHEFELISLRLAAALRRLDGIEIPEPLVPLFGSAAEAAEHGKSAIDDPPEEAFVMGERLARKYGRLRKEL